MTATGSRPLDTLSPESKAMLSLVLVQGRSFQQIAEMLHMSPADVRARAHAAAFSLVSGPDERLSLAGRERIVDYLLGEQSVSERELTRSELTSLEASREWARELSRSLATFAKEPLPSIPEPAPAIDPEPAPAIDPEPVPAADPEPEPTPVVAAFVAPPVPPAPSFPTPRPAAAPPARERHRVPTGWLVAALIVLVGAFAAIVVLATSGGTSSSPARGVAPGTVNVPVTGGAGTGGKGPVKTVRRLVLTPASAGSQALGAGVVVSQRGKLLLLLQARGLQPNHHNSYGVWLYNSPGDAEMLGFVPQPVGADGTFSSSVKLPDDAVRFHSLIVTLETSQLPKKPGTTVLRAALSVP
jgi:Trp operon repressor